VTFFLARSESLGAFSLLSRETVDTELELSSVPPTSLSLFFFFLFLFFLFFFFFKLNHSAK